MKIILSIFLSCCLGFAWGQDTLFIYYAGLSALDVPPLRKNTRLVHTNLPHQVGTIDTIVYSYSTPLASPDEEVEAWSFEQDGAELWVMPPVGSTRLEIENPNGQIIHSQPIPTNTQQLQVDVSQLPNGLYILRLRNNSQSWEKNLVIQR